MPFPSGPPWTVCHDSLVAQRQQEKEHIYIHFLAKLQLSFSDHPSLPESAGFQRGHQWGPNTLEIEANLRLVPVLRCAIQYFIMAGLGSCTFLGLGSNSIRFPTLSAWYVVTSSHAGPRRSTSSAFTVLDLRRSTSSEASRSNVPEE